MSTSVKCLVLIFFWRSQTNKPQLTEICLDPTEVKLLTANNWLENAPTLVLQTSIIFYHFHFGTDNINLFGAIPVLARAITRIERT